MSFVIQQPCFHCHPPSSFISLQYFSIIYFQMLKLIVLSHFQKLSQKFGSFWSSTAITFVFCYYIVLFLARRNTNGNSYWSLFWLLAWWFFIILSHCLHMQLTYYFTSNCVTDSMLQSVFSIFHIFYHCL